LVVAADRVSMEIAKTLGCEALAERPGDTSHKYPALPSAQAEMQPLEEFEFSSLRIDFTQREC